MMNTHLCGSVYDASAEGRCPHLLYADKPEMMRGKRKLQLYSAYCTADNRCRSLGNVATFTGNSPTWCSRRKELGK